MEPVGATKSVSQPDAKLVELTRGVSPTWKPLLDCALFPLEKALRLDLVNEAYRHTSGQDSSQAFIADVLEYLNISYAVPEQDMDQIARTGPLLVVANHPFGAIEGLILASVLRQRRPDVKIMANHLLGRIPELSDLFVLVNPFSTAGASKQNVSPMRQAISQLRDGGVLGIFPAGEVAHLTWKGRITECQWKAHVARLVRLAKCPVLPVYFSGHNSMLFQLAGLAHPKLRTAMLARELFRMRGTRLDVRIGSPIPFARIARMEEDQDLVDRLRARTMMLSCRQAAEAKPIPTRRPQVPTIAPIDPAVLEAEVASLKPDQFLAEGGDMVAYLGHVGEIPNILREIGRLREITFRETGEGTGREVDLDAFDDHYHHLFLWHRPSRQVVGGYRVGFSDVILKNEGIHGFYTHSLFRIRPELLQKLGPTLELGRSFVRPEFQKSYAPLLLLWKGISKIVCNNPKYRHLLGPVSISASYQTMSRQLMVDFLNCHFAASDLDKLVKPRNPFRSHLRALFHHPVQRDMPADTEQLSDLVRDLEGDGKGLPVLLRQYLKLGAKVLAFNVDPDFSDVLDALIVVDLLHADRKVLDRYMGAEACTAFRAACQSQAPTA